MKILIAEDEITSRQMLEMTLKKLGHEVIVCKDGDEAWETWQRDPLSIVITDWMMPGLSGIELCKRIREHDEKQYTFVVLLTAKEDQDSYQEAFRAGVDDFLSKPFQKMEIEGRLRSAQRITEMEHRISSQNRKLETALGHIRKDLDAAAQIQQSLLPIGVERIQDLEFSWRLEPCASLAGDIFNIVRLNDHETGIYLLDVSGHGAVAALMSVTLSRLLTSTDRDSLLYSKEPDRAGEPLRPAAMLEKLNQQFQIRHSENLEQSSGQYFTIFYGIHDHRSGEFEYSCAGSPPVFKVDAKGNPETLSIQSFPIGFVENPEYENRQVSMKPDDYMVIFSDGLVEIPNAGGDFFGVDRLGETLRSFYRATNYSTLDLLIDHLIHQAKNWNPDTPIPDDLSILIFRRKDHAD